MEHPEAADALVWLIPYRHPNGRVWFERMRFIDPADLERFGGGKYRQPARGRTGTGAQLYDPYLLLSPENWEPRDSILLIEGEANTVAVHTLLPDDAVIGLPGQSSLTQKMASTLGAIPVVFLWIDRHDKAAAQNAQRIAERLLDEGVQEVRQLPSAMGMDANDLLANFGHEKARQAVLDMIGQAQPVEGPLDGEWPLMATPVPPPFPVDALPAKLARFVAAVATQTQTPPDLAALGVLGVLSAVAMNATVDCGVWTEKSLGLYTLAVLPSGDRKSEVLDKVIGPLYQLEREWRENAEGVIQDAKTTRETHEARKQELTTRFAKGDDPAERENLREQIVGIEAELAKVGNPARPLLLADDATPEVLASLLAEQPQIAVLSDEAAAIDNFIGRYSEKGKPNLHLACKAYSASPARVHRRGREEILPRPLLAVTLFSQPFVLETIVGHGVARGQGLVGRFAYSLPTSLLGHRIEDPPRVSRELHDAWADIVQKVNTAVGLTKLTNGSVSFVSAPLSAAQFDILRMLAEHDVITSSDAGRIVHAHREPPCERCRRGCCGFTSTDGNEALKRLKERGFVRKLAAGLWTARQ